MSSTVNDSSTSPKLRLDLMKFEELGCIYDSVSTVKRKPTNFLSVKIKENQLNRHELNIGKKESGSQRKKGVIYCDKHRLELSNVLKKEKMEFQPKGIQRCTQLNDLQKQLEFNNDRAQSTFEQFKRKMRREKILSSQDIDKIGNNSPVVSTRLSHNNYF